MCGPSLCLDSHPPPPLPPLPHPMVPCSMEFLPPCITKSLIGLKSPGQVLKVSLQAPATPGEGRGGGARQAACGTCTCRDCCSSSRALLARMSCCSSLGAACLPSSPRWHPDHPAPGSPLHQHCAPPHHAPPRCPGAGRARGDLPHPAVADAHLPARQEGPHPAAVPHGHRLHGLDQLRALHRALLALHRGPGAGARRARVGGWVAKTRCPKQSVHVFLYKKSAHTRNIPLSPEQVLGEDLVLVAGQQDRLLRGGDTWNAPVSYDKMGVRYRRWRNSVQVRRGSGTKECSCGCSLSRCVSLRPAPAMACSFTLDCTPLTALLLLPPAGRRRRLASRGSSCGGGWGGHVAAGAVPGGG